MIHPPTSWAQVKDTYGDIARYVRVDGTLEPAWEEEKIVRIRLPEAVKYAFDSTVMITQITVHTLVAEVAVQMYAEMWQKGLWPALGPYGGGFNFRRNRNNSHVLSLHSWGLAHDWDPNGFPNGSPKERDPGLVSIARKYGWRWGQEFQHPDPMHTSFSAGAVG